MGENETGFRTKNGDIQGKREGAARDLVPKREKGDIVNGGLPHTYQAMRINGSNKADGRKV
jgi:hypothetical protein